MKCKKDFSELQMCCVVWEHRKMCSVLSLHLLTRNEHPITFSTSHLRGVRVVFFFFFLKVLCDSQGLLEGTNNTLWQKTWLGLGWNFWVADLAEDWGNPVSSCCPGSQNAMYNPKRCRVNQPSVKALSKLINYHPLWKQIRVCYCTVITHLCWRTAAKSLGCYWSHGLHCTTQRILAMAHVPSRETEKKP